MLISPGERGRVTDEAEDTGDQGEGPGVGKIVTDMRGTDTPTQGEVSSTSKIDSWSGSVLLQDDNSVDEEIDSFTSPKRRDVQKPDSTTKSQQEQSDAQFAAALSAKLHDLDPGIACSPRGSPDDDGASPLASCSPRACGSSPPPGTGDYENPSSMETQGDALFNNSGSPSVDSMEHLDLDMPTVSPDCPSYLPVIAEYGPALPEGQYGPALPESGILPSQDLDSDSEMLGCLLKEEGPSKESESRDNDQASDSAEAGVCGFRNLGNTCYMNSGLQCVLATPTILQFFLNFSLNLQAPSKDTGKENDAKKSNIGFALTKSFSSLAKKIYSGKYSVIKPVSFKETLSSSHSQFKGYRQHDCQEFLALLLDSLHEQLVHIQPPSKGPMSECTSMELHTPHSTEVSCDDGKDTVFSFSESGKILKDVDSVSDLDRTYSACPDLESVSNLEPVTVGGVSSGADEIDSRGSASPKSYTSHSSLDDKFPSNIRMAPIPEGIKATSSWNGESRASIASLDDSHTTESDLDLVDEDSGGGGGSSTGQQITSNLVPNEQLMKKKQVVFCDSNLTSTSSSSMTAIGTATAASGSGACTSGTTTSSSDEQPRNNAVSPMNVGIEDFLKEHKTLNVNMNITDSTAGGSMNNKINFDSEKFAKHGYLENTRPPTTIENLNNREISLAEKNVNIKRGKSCNLELDGNKDTSSNMEDKLCKRIRLDSTEKNFLLESERRECELEVLDSQTEPPSCCSETARDPGRLKEAIEADRYWENYLSSNFTVMARTFQGQFKNTIICSQCGHVSVSFEPFMYLSIPLPRANEIQVEVTVHLATLTPTQHLVTLSKHDTIGEIRAILERKLNASALKLIFCEVTKHRITRELEDSVWIKFVNTTNRKLYCIQMLELDVQQSGPSSCAQEMSEVETKECVSSTTCQAKYAGPSSGASGSTSSSCNVSSSTATSTTASNSHSVASTSTGSTAITSGILTEVPCAMDMAGDGAGGGAGFGGLTSETVSSSMRSSLSSSRSDLGGAGVSSSMRSSLSSSRSDLGAAVSSSTSTATLTETGTLTQGMEAWKSCSICLEEMADSDLITHLTCSAILCRECLRRSFKHQEGVERCPLCREACVEADWVQLDQSQGAKPPLRMLRVHVVEQGDCGGKPFNYGHPRMLTLPNCVSLARVNSLLGDPQDTQDNLEPILYLVDESTEKCSRCEPAVKCFGCPLSSLSENGEVILKPGDKIAKRIHSVDRAILEERRRVVHDSSMDEERVAPVLSLDDCLRAFSSRELLDHNNPWFCPVCRKNRTATKTLSVWRYPDFLIIILKRFVYLEKGPGGVAGSVKLDKRVEFPIQDLDLNPYLSGPLQHGGELFNLYATVCHFGSPTGGHYTSYAKHPISGDWHYFNDSQVENKIPEGDRQDDAYVLFYERSGLNFSVSIPPKMEEHEIECSEDRLTNQNKQEQTDGATASYPTVEPETVELD